MSLACRPFASEAASVVRQSIWHSPLGGVDPDDVEVAVVHALLVLVGVASAAPGPVPQRSAVPPGLVALAVSRAGRRQRGAGPGQRGPCS